MSTVMISFLGRSPKKDGNYRVTKYYINKEEQTPTAYVGYLLREYYKPQKFVVLGTSGSMWDNLFDKVSNLKEHEENLLLSLVEAVEHKNVNQKQLDELTPLLSEELKCEVELKITPSAFNQSEQLQILQAIAGAAIGAEKLILDITHGYRHLPMLAYTAILYLQSIQPNLQVEHILYGEFDHDTGKGEVLDLVGLLEINKWSNAIRHSEATGDYSAVSALLDDKEMGDWLSEASYQESIHRGVQARSPLKKVRKKIAKEPLVGPASLFQPLLIERTDWVDENRLYQRQRTQAFRSLERHDYLRAALYGFEAFLTRKIQDADDSIAGTEGPYEQRKKVTDSLNNRKYKNTEEGKSYYRLRNIRNTLAHGDQNSVKETQQDIHSAEQLSQVLKEVLNTLLT